MQGLRLLLVAGLVAGVAACTQEDPRRPVDESTAFQKQLQTQLIKAKPGDVITIPEGIHPINRGLSLNVSGVTIRGHGMDKSILSFKGQVQGRKACSSMPAISRSRISPSRIRRATAEDQRGP